MKKLEAVALVALLVLTLVFSQWKPRFIPLVHGSNPSTVSTTTYKFSIIHSCQPKTFYAHDMYWAFFTDGTNMVYCTSSDGESWSDKTTVRAADKGKHFSVWFDGTYLHYSYAGEITTLKYRRGNPNSTGGIDWLAVEQTVSTSFDACEDSFVSVDSDGYAWIGYRDRQPFPSFEFPYVIKSGNNDGTWGTTPVGFPYQLSTTTSPHWHVQAVPLSDSMMLTVAGDEEQRPLEVERWDGSSWDTEDTADTNMSAGWAFSAVADSNDDVHICFQGNDEVIKYVMYDNSTNLLGSETIVQDSITTANHAVIVTIDPTTEDLHCFWSGYPTADHIYYKKYSIGSWDADPTDWIDESTDGLPDNGTMSGFVQAGQGWIGLLYTTKADSPYDVKFVYKLAENPAPVINQLRLSTTISETNITTIDVFTWYDWEVNVTDDENLLDIYNLTIRIENNPANTISEDAPSYTKATEYWFRYLNSTDSWEWYSGSTWTSTSDWLNTTGCSYPSKSGTQGWYLFRVKLGKTAAKSSLWEFSALVYDGSDQTATKIFSSITVNFYSEISITTTTHTWAIIQGQNDVLIDQGTLDFTVTSNAVFKIQAKGSGDLASNGDTLGLGNITIHKDTLGSSISLTTSYVDVGGLTGQSAGEDLALSVKLWCDVPAGQPEGDYVYMLYLQVTQDV